MIKLTVFLCMLVVKNIHSQRTDVSLNPVSQNLSRVSQLNKKFQVNLNAILLTPVTSDVKNMEQQKVKQKIKNNAEKIDKNYNCGEQPNTNQGTNENFGKGKIIPEMSLGNRSSFNGDKCPKGFVKVLGECVKEHK